MSRSPKKAAIDAAATQTGKSWLDLLRGGRAGHVVILMLAISLHAMDVFVIATILPTLVADIGGAAFYTWPTMLYMIASIVGASSGALIRVRFGMRAAPVLAAAIYMTGALIAAAAPRIEVLLVGRAIQGLGGGMLVALSYTMINQLFSAELRPRVLALVSVAWGVSALVGPLIGGGFAQLGYWRGAFLIFMPVLCLLGVLAWRTLTQAAARPSVAPTLPPTLPWRRLALLGAGVLSVAFSGQIDAVIGRIALVVLAIGLVALFLNRDGRADSPLLPTRPASLMHPVGTAYWMFFLFGLTYSPIGVFMPLLAQQLQGLSPFAAGYVQATMAIGWSLTAIVVAGLTLGWQRVLVVAGPLTLLIAIIGQSQTINDGPLGLLVVFIFLTGTGVGLSHAHISNWSMTLTRRDEGNLTAAAIPMVQSLGIAFGAAAGGLIANAAGLDAGLDRVTVAAAAKWIYGFCMVPPLIAVALGLRLRVLRDRFAP